MGKQTRFGLGVFLFVFNRDFSKILLVKRNEEKRNKYGFAWGTIGGKLELGEHSIDGAIREAREEIGVKLKRSELKQLEIIEIPNFTEDCHGFAFKYGAILDEKTKITTNEESDEYEWFSLGELPKERNKDDNIVAIAKLAKKVFRVL